MTSYHKAQAAKCNRSAGKWRRQRSGPALFGANDSLFANHLITSEKKKIIIIKRKRRWTRKKRLTSKSPDKKNNWQKSIRNEGQWVIHLLLRHNYLFFLPSFTSLFMWDNHVAAKPKKNTLYFFPAIIQIKHRLLRENVCQTTMPQREKERERQKRKRKRRTSPGAKRGDPIRSQPTYCKFSILLPQTGNKLINNLLNQISNPYFILWNMNYEEDLARCLHPCLHLIWTLGSRTGYGNTAAP